MLASMCIIALCFSTPSRVDTHSRTVIAVMDLDHGPDIPTELAATLSVTIASELEKAGPFRSLSKQDVKAMLQFERYRDALGCDDLKCLAEIAAALGSDLLVTGGIARINNTTMLRLQLISVKQAVVVERVSRKVSGPLDQIIDEARVASRLLVRTIAESQTGMLAVDVEQEGATIRIDGDIAGVTPATKFSLGAGMHHIDIEKDGFIVFRRDVTIEPHSETELHTTLIPSADYLNRQLQIAKRNRRIAWSSLVGGAVMTGLGATMFGINHYKAHRLNTSARQYNDASTRQSVWHETLTQEQNTIRAYSLAALILSSVGIIGLGAGSALLWHTDEPATYSKPHPSQP